MEGRVDRVRPLPVLVHRRVGADDVVVRHEVAVAKLLDSLGVGAEVGDGAADFCLGKRDADVHACSVSGRTGCAVPIHL